MTNITLNKAHLEDYTPGTDEYGQANLRILMDYALDTVEEITKLAAFAHRKGEIDTPVVSKKGLIMHIGTALYDEDREYAEMWKNTFSYIWDAVAQHWANANPYAYITEDGGLWIDMVEVLEAMAAQKEAA